jgi:hypothetical protein
MKGFLLGKHPFTRIVCTARIMCVADRTQAAEYFLSSGFSATLISLGELATVSDVSGDL